MAYQEESISPVTLTLSRSGAAVSSLGPDENLALLLKSNFFTSAPGEANILSPGEILLRPHWWTRANNTVQVSPCMHAV